MSRDYPVRRPCEHQRGRLDFAEPPDCVEANNGHELSLNRVHRRHQMGVQKRPTDQLALVLGDIVLAVKKGQPNLQRLHERHPGQRY